MSEARAELPEGWKWVGLGDVCEAIRGVTFSRGEARDEPFDGGIACLTTSGVQNEVAWDSRRFIPRDAAKREEQVLQCGDILVSTANSKALVGKSCVVTELPFECTFGAFVTVLRPKKIAADLLAHWMRSSKALSYFYEKSSNTTNISNLRVSDLLELEMPLLPPEEQQRVLEMLHLQMAEVDKARAATEAQLEAAGKLPNASLREAFESEQGQEWPRRPLGEVCEITAKLVDPKLPEYKVLPHVSGENIQSGLCRLINVRTAEEDGMTSGKYIFEAREVLYSKLRPYLRKVALSEFQGLCSADMYPLRVNPDVLTPEFTAWMLLSEEFTAYADGQSQRSRMPKLNREQLFSWNIPCPPLDEQRRIASQLTLEMQAFEVVKEKLMNQLETVNALPASLLRQAFSGELTRQPLPEDIRAALTCLAVERLHHRVFFGVVQLMKVLYFAQVQLDIPLGYTMRRHTYGPFDKAMYDLEKEGERQGWFSVDKAVDKQGSRYVPGTELDSLAREAKGTLDRWKGELNGLLELAESFDTTGLEALATLHAAWNDLLLEGRQPKDSEIIAEVLEGWPGKKEKFQKGELRTYLAYLKTSPYVPKGTGQSTKLIPS